MIENPMYLADAPEPEHFVEHNVDLKWSLWSLDEGAWEERYPGLWQEMHDAFHGFATVAVETAPRKEIRFGSVKISKGKAEVNFTAEWDNGRIFRVEETVLANLFENLMHSIDHREIDLMRKEHQAYHGKHGQKLSAIRCHECGYPYVNNGSMRLAE